MNNPVRTIANWWRQRRVTGVAISHGWDALAARARHDSDTYRREMSIIAGHGHAAIYLTVCGWFHVVRREANLVAPTDGGVWTISFGDGENIIIDNPDTVTGDGRHLVWAGRLLGAILNDDKDTAVALYATVAAAGTDTVNAAVNVAADLAIGILAHTDAATAPPIRDDG